MSLTLHSMLEMNVVLAVTLVVTCCCGHVISVHESGQEDQDVMRQLERRLSGYDSSSQLAGRVAVRDNSYQVLHHHHRRRIISG